MAIHALAGGHSVDTIIKDLAERWDNVVLTRFHQIARERIREEVQKGNSEFGIQIDGRAGDYARIDQARKVIRVQFAGVALKVALRIAKEELSKSIKETTGPSVGNPVGTGRLAANIVVFVGRQGKQFEIVDNLDEFRFSPGDVVAFTILAPYGPVTNRNVTVASSKRRTAQYEARKRRRGPIQPASTKRGQGFMGLAAKRINQEIGSQKGLGSISVTAGFSKSLQAAAGVEVYGKPKNQHGVAAIFVTLRYLTRSKVIGI